MINGCVGMLRQGDAGQSTKPLWCVLNLDGRGFGLLQFPVPAALTAGRIPCFDLASPDRENNKHFSWLIADCKKTVKKQKVAQPRRLCRRQKLSGLKYCCHGCLLWDGEQNTERK
jgi:hypothetical protein